MLTTSKYTPFTTLSKATGYFCNGKSGYRFSFNGKENDNEVKGYGGQQDYGMRVYDNRLGRFLSVDPLGHEYPYYSSYQFAGNTPIEFVDLDGGEPKVPFFLSPPGSTLILAKKCSEITGNLILGMLNFVFHIPNAISLADNAGHIKDKQKRAQIENEAKNELAKFAIEYTTGYFIGKAFSVFLSAFPKPVNGPTTTMFRVQGGVIPNASKERFILNGNSLSIEGEEMLFLNFGDEARAVEFAMKRGEESYIIKAEVNQAFVDKVKELAVPQSQGRLNPFAPQKVDATKTDGSYGIPSSMFEELLENIITKSVEKVETKVIQNGHN